MPFPTSLTLGGFPQVRLRRLRRFDWLRELVQENHLNCSDLIWGIIVRDPSLPATVPTMPDLHRYTVQELPAAIEAALKLGIRVVALFPALPFAMKSENADEILKLESLYARAISVIKEKYPEMGVISDVALDPFTSHGQDGILINGHIDNDTTLTVLAKAAVIQAQAGADIIGPSEMMDGRVKIIREALDQSGYHQVSIASYGAKYASSFYGPYRDAVNTSQCLGHADKKTYYVDIANADDALREVALDVQEGADMIIIKPGLPYLDIVQRVRQTFKTPVISFQISGEYAMLKIAAQNGMLNYEKALYECLMSFKRAGASGIITYAALDAAKIIRELTHGA